MAVGGACGERGKTSAASSGQRAVVVWALRSLVGHAFRGEAAGLERGSDRRSAASVCIGPFRPADGRGGWRTLLRALLGPRGGGGPRLLALWLPARVGAGRVGPFRLALGLGGRRFWPRRGLCLAAHGRSGVALSGETCC